MRRQRVIVVVGLLLACSSVSSLLAADLDLKQRMSAAEFQRCGLHKLSSEELTALNAWVWTYAEEAVRTSMKVAETKEPAVIESHIRGEFEGWEGDTIFVLDNGQVWEQVEYHYHYHYAFRPAVTIVKTRRGWVMKVEGISKSIKVERVR